jgi:murein DD-endopeptidase MepM/ murein hydrolase activator NlpD
VLPRRRRLAVLAIVAGLTASLGAPAIADGGADHVIPGLDALTARIERATRRVDRWTRATWDPEVAEALDTAGLHRIERALASAEVASAEVLDPLIGPTAPDEIPAAITAALSDANPADSMRIGLSATLSAWDRFRTATDEGRALRDRLRRRLGFPLVTGLRVCPIEGIDPFLHDWGDNRGWRTHKGTDITAETGIPLVAMERGVIVQMGWHYLGGNQVYLLGDMTGDVYYYAHMDSIDEGLEVGVAVSTGQLIGYVGTTGNADVPHLHLGWMPGAGGVDLTGLADAYPLLVELCL